MNLTSGMRVRILPGARPSNPAVTASASWLRVHVGDVVEVVASTPDSDGDVYVEPPGPSQTGAYVLPQYLGPVDEAPAYGIRNLAGELIRALPASPPAPTYAERVQALKDAVASFANVRGYSDGLTPEKALAVAAFLLGEAPR